MKVLTWSVKDGDVRVPSEFRGKFFVVKERDQITSKPEERKAKALYYRVHHHNACDHFILRTPWKATYSATAFTGFGEDLSACGNFPPETNPQPKSYRFIYEDKKVDGPLSCDHYVFRCQN